MKEKMKCIKYYLMKGIIVIFLGGMLLSLAIGVLTEEYREFTDDRNYTKITNSNYVFYDVFSGEIETPLEVYAKLPIKASDSIQIKRSRQDTYYTNYFVEQTYGKYTIEVCKSEDLDKLFNLNSANK